MKLYRIMFDGQFYFVEAESYGAAIEIWHQHCRKDDHEWDTPETPEPEEVALAHEGPVLRRMPGMTEETRKATRMWWSGFILGALLGLLFGGLVG